MSINIVRKHKSTVLVKKGRNIKEQYIASLGVMSDAEFKDCQKKVTELAQEDRISFCQRQYGFVEVDSTLPRRKEIKPTKGFIKPKPKVRKLKNKEVVPTKAEIKKSKRPEKQSVVLKEIKPQQMNVSHYRTLQAKQGAIKDRIAYIDRAIEYTKNDIKRASERFSITRHKIPQMKYRIESGKTAIKLLKKQRSELRR